MSRVGARRLTLGCFAIVIGLAGFALNHIEAPARRVFNDWAVRTIAAPRRATLETGAETGGVPWVSRLDIGRPRTHSNGLVLPAKCSPLKVDT